MKSQRPPLIVYPSRVRTFFWTIVALAFVGVGVVAAIFPPGAGASSWERFIATYIGVPFFGLCFAHEVRKLVWRKPVLIVTDEGMFINVGAFPLGFIRWEEVEDIYPCQGAYGIQLVRIVLKDRETVISRLPLLTRILIRTAAKKGGRRIGIPDMGLRFSTEQLFSKMWEYMPDKLTSA